ncbi:ANKRD32 [Ecytonucleospora hepatopenaei]|uniref:ANKRD32 n=1 Tax=Ecytonucleospora hepatopenaei TaxID=646526 RepID=A0A1W0E7P4_9MICR|nr:ANKRD32 [Ecytonucleospora hepatopenaei]
MNRKINEICFTGISHEELCALNILKDNKKHTNDLNKNTKYLVTYKSIFSEKYVEALSLDLPIISIESFHDQNKSYTQDTLKNLLGRRLSKFEGAVFTTSGLTNPIYANYFILNGATFEPRCDISTDFLICDNYTSEKYAFCKKYKIPIIETKDVFSNKYHLFLHKQRFDAKSIGMSGLFENIMFFIDENLPEELYNKLKRMIIENDGMRQTNISESVDFILTTPTNASFFEGYKNILYYQYLFDCISTNSLLHENFYVIHSKKEKVVLNNCVIFIDRENIRETLIDQENVDEEFIEEHCNRLENKIKSLGAILQDSLDMRTTHCITSINKNDPQYFCVTEEWVDNCLIYLKHFDESKYAPRKKVFGRRKPVKVQVTGLGNDKANVIKRIEEFGINIVDSEKYENCTHLIMGSFCTSEKFFGALVNGAWILTTDYLHDINLTCSNIFNNVDLLEKYEWNVDEKHASLNKLSKINKKLISSISKWRLKIKAGKQKPFTSWNVKIYADKNKFQMFSKMIKNGGGRITNEEDFTHIFYDKSYKENVKEEKKLPLSYIFEYLSK